MQGEVKGPEVVGSGPGPEEAPPEGGVLARVWRAVGDLFTNEVYVLASAIAFNGLLSFFPFLLLMLSFCKNVLRSRPAYDAILTVMRDYLPTGQDFIVRNLQVVVTSFGKGEVFSIILLLFTSSGILIPVQIALNRAWRVAGKPRDMKGQLAKDFKDQGLAFGIIVLCGLIGLAYTSLLAAVQSLAAAGIGTGPVATLMSGVLVKTLALPLPVLIFFILYVALPDRRIPARKALPAAVFGGLAWEVARIVCFWWVFPWLNFKEAYGPFYISVTLVMWAFVSSMILLLGANLSAQNLLPAMRREKTKKA